MKKYYTILILLTIILLNTQFIYSQWVQTNGPNGGDITCFATSGNNIFAGTIENGVHRSTDNGISWTQAGLKGERILTSLIFSGSNLFAGSYDNGVYLSTDYGTIWKHTGFSGRVECLAVMGTKIFAVSEAPNLPGGIFLSTDNGTSWTKVSSGDESWIYALAVMGTNIYAGASGGIYHLTNDTIWTLENNGLSDIDVRCLTIGGNNIFAGTYFREGFNNGGVFISTDNGMNWDSAGMKGYSINSLAIRGTKIFAGTDSGVFLSTNDGANWSVINNELTDIHVQVLFATNDNIFAGTDNGGIFRSTNDGVSWTQVGLNVTGCPVLAIKDSLIFAGTYDGGGSISTNGGINWKQLKNNGLPSDVTFNSLLTSGNNIIAVSMSHIFIDNGFLFLSTDNGINWTKPDSVNFFNAYTSLVKSGNNIFAGTDSGLVLSSDNGINWRHAGTRDLDIILLALRGNNLIAITGRYNVYASSDTGAHWTQNYAFNHQWVNSIIANGNTIFAVVTTDYGLFEGVFLSDNNGKNWTAYNDGLDSSDVFSFIVSGTNLFAGTDKGVYLFSNSKRNWTQMGMNKMFVISLAVDDNYLYAGTASAGVWKRPLSEITNVANREKVLPKEFTLSQNYPNPFNPTTAISYSLPSASNVKLMVYNALGQTVKVIENTFKQTGNYTVHFNGSNLASGIYFYKLEAGQFIQIKKMMLLK